METLKRLIPLLLVTAALLGLYWWQSREPAEPELQTTTAPTTKPTTTPTTTPTTQPTTATTTAPTEPPVPVLTVDMWLVEPEYPSYEELFSKDAAYSDFGYDWIVPQEEGYRVFDVDDWAGYIRIRDTGHEEEYAVPNTENFRKEYGNPQYMGCDGKYAYYSNQEMYGPELPYRILRLELQTGQVEILAEETRIYSVSGLLANCVVYYIREAGDGAQVCRLYIPEKRVDVLQEIAQPEYLFPGSMRAPSGTLGSISWYGLNPELVKKAEALWADPNAQKVINQYDYTEVWKEFGSGLSGMGQDFREMFFHDLQEQTGIWGLERTVFDPATGKVTKTKGTLDNCWLGSGYPHDHFNPVYRELPAPRAAMGDWHPLPERGQREEIPPQVAGEYPYAATLRVPGQAHSQVFRIDGGKVTLVKDAPWEVIGYGRDAVYCLTEENAIMELSADGRVCNTVYASEGEKLRDFEFHEGMLCFREDSRILLLDLEKGQYRVLMEDARVDIESWFPGEDWILISLRDGLYYQQYRFYIDTGVIEETHIL